MQLLNAHKRISQVMFKFGCVRLGFVSYAHAQRIMGNDIIISPQDFKQQSRWYCRVGEVTKYDFGVVTYGITSVPNFRTIFPDTM
jgi:hypothetical protein